MARESVPLPSFDFRAPTEKMLGALDVYGVAISMVVPSGYWFALGKARASASEVGNDDDLVSQTRIADASDSLGAKAFVRTVMVILISDIWNTEFFGAFCALPGPVRTGESMWSSRRMVQRGEGRGGD